MKLPSFVSLLVLASVAAQAQSGGSFEIKSSVIAGGATLAASADHRFTLSGTVGQLEAAPVLRSADQRFALEPGYWHGIRVVPTTGAPMLKIQPGLRDTAILSWPVDAGDFVLEETASLNGRVEWSLTEKEFEDTATEHTVTVPCTGLMKIYRLRKR